MPPHVLGRGGETQVLAASPDHHHDLAPGVRLDRLPELALVTMRSPLMESTTSPALNPARSPGFPAMTAYDNRIGVRQDANVPDLVAPFSDRAYRERLRLPVAKHRHSHVALRLGGDGDQQVFPGVDPLAGDRENPVAWTQTHLLGRRSGHDRSNHRRLVAVGEDFGALRQHERRHDHGEHDVHQRSHDQDLEPLPLGLGEKLVGLARPRVVRVLARHLDVTAERDGADAVFRVAAREFQDLGPETEREREHANADPPRRQEMPQLVDEDQDAENEEKCQQGRHLREPLVLPVVRCLILTPAPFRGRSRRPIDRPGARPPALRRVRPDARSSSSL